MIETKYASSSTEDEFKDRSWNMFVDFKINACKLEENMSIKCMWIGNKDKKQSSLIEDEHKDLSWNTHQ